MKGRKVMRNRILLGLAAAGAAAVLAWGQKHEEQRRTLLENDRVRVREVFIEPGIDYSPHTHQYAHVGVIVKGRKLEFTERGKSETVDVKDGDAGWRDSGVTHSIRNIGKTRVHVVEVELKK